MKSVLKWLTRRAGYEVVSLRRPALRDGLFPADFGEDDVKTYLAVRPFTQTTPERVFVLTRAVEYILAHDIPGAFVECGVWKGGSMMAVALALTRAGRRDRGLFLFDTYQGMPEPVAQDGEGVRTEWEKNVAATHNGWNYAPLDEVRANLNTTGYPPEHLHYVVGKVEKTVPASAPETVALLRLDTDFYESTRHELEHLFPRLSRGGVLIVDDYGAFQGARLAVDEYLREKGICLLLNRIDQDSRIAVKL
jgi:hypothetical protein